MVKISQLSLHLVTLLNLNTCGLLTRVSKICRERDVAPWYEHSLMVRWVVGSILHGEPIELFLVLASAPQLV